MPKHPFDHKLATAGKRHLLAANDPLPPLPAKDIELARRFGFGDLTEADLQLGDLENNVDKGPRASSRANANALALQQQHPTELELAMRGRS